MLSLPFIITRGFESRMTGIDYDKLSIQFYTQMYSAFKKKKVLIWRKVFLLQVFAYL
jgi:hypothetical protein